MTLTSYVLVVFERGEAESMRAGFRYFVATHAGTACMLLAVLLLYRWAGAEGFDFAGMRAGMAALVQERAAVAHLVLALFFIGFATKAGVLPFGFWLPDAYPAAPSSAGAAFAGTMTKLGVYGLVRVFVEFLPASPFCIVWGQIIAVMGTISIFVGTVTALVQSDSKRLLSFHIIGQVGYMLLGVGTGVAFLRVSPALAVAGLVGGLFHLVNHAFYKSLLFLNAGAGLYRTGTRDLGKVGGLISIMPLTGVTAIIASLSIAGIPPFSGFSSKWLIFAGSINAALALPLFAVLAAIAIFISAVTLASFLKFLGTLFLGRLDVGDREVERAEVPLTMRAPQVLIAVFCLLFGLAPVLPVGLIYRAVAGVLPEGYAPNFSSLFGDLALGVSLNLGQGVIGVWNPLWVVVGLLAGLLIGWGLYRLGGAPERKTEPWLCGEPHGVGQVRYRSHGFYLPFKEFLSFRVGRVVVDTYFPPLPRPRVGGLDSLRRAVNVDEWLYYPLVSWAKRACERFRETHVGIPQVYVLWMAIGVVLAIAVLFGISGR